LSPKQIVKIISVFLKSILYIKILKKNNNTFFYKNFKNLKFNCKNTLN
jgi:hypothetical protein